MKKQTPTQAATYNADQAIRDLHQEITMLQIKFRALSSRIHKLETRGHDD